MRHQEILPVKGAVTWVTISEVEELAGQEQLRQRKGQPGQERFSQTVLETYAQST